jgi:hypothetical protein
MIELLEQLLEQDFEDLFQPVSDEDAKKRIDELIDSFLNDKDFIKWAKMVWNRNDEWIAEEYGMLEFGGLKDLADLFDQILIDDILQMHDYSGEVHPDALKYGDTAPSIRDEICSRLIRDVLKIDLKKFR